MYILASCALLLGHSTPRSHGWKDRRGEGGGGVVKWEEEGWWSGGGGMVESEEEHLEF